MKLFDDVVRRLFLFGNGWFGSTFSDWSRSLTFKPSIEIGNIGKDIRK
jgi:hypothetical protein